ncbi:MAG: cobalamin B12-binding domain-containing protein [Deltaproteobacteria bacterium]|nr:cobalamin B12-binding domain-containing protein [Deltaproteobacteria bacterium]
MPYRVIVAKPGLDGHDRGAKVIARALRDAGFEVIYTGLRRSVESIVSAAVQEDVDLIGLSLLSGAHIPLTKKLMAKLDEAGVRIPVVVGGTIPERDIPVLRRLGVRDVFTPTTPLNEVVQAIQAIVEGEAQSSAVSGPQG